jgi:hypothetical protein
MGGGWPRWDAQEAHAKKFLISQFFLIGTFWENQPVRATLSRMDLPPSREHTFHLGGWSDGLQNKRD